MARTEETGEAWALSSGLCFVRCGIGPGDQGAARVPPRQMCGPPHFSLYQRPNKKTPPSQNAGAGESHVFAAESVPGEPGVEHGFPRDIQLPILLDAPFRGDVPGQELDVRADDVILSDGLEHGPQVC